MVDFLKKNKLIIVIIAVFFTAIFSFFFSESKDQTILHGSEIFLWIAIILIIAKLSSLIEKMGQPAVLGELIMGALIGNAALIGITYFDAIKANEIIKFLAEFGAIILLFQTGLETDVTKITAVKKSAIMVGAIGMIIPFVLGVFIAGPLLLPNLSIETYLFIGAALTATSVGITIRVLRDLKQSKSREAQIILGAAIIDDILGLILLAVLTAFVSTGKISVIGIIFITFKAIIFLAGSIYIGQKSAEVLGKMISKIHTGIGMKFSLALIFCLFFSYMADVVGLAPIIGAFAAGIILDPVHFKFFDEPRIINRLKSMLPDLSEKNKPIINELLSHHSEHHISELIRPLAHFLIPIFFITAGMEMQLSVLANPKILFASIILTVLAIAGKFVSGFAASDAKKSVVGAGMVPRGEVGLIFATIGQSLGVITPEVFSILIIVIIATTLATPPLLTHLIKKPSYA